MPFWMTIPAFVALIFMLAIPFLNGREFRLMLKLLALIVVIGAPPVIGAMEARNAQEFWVICGLVLMAPLLWLLEAVQPSGAGGPARHGTGGGLLDAILPWLPTLGLTVMLAMAMTLGWLHWRAKRRGWDDPD